MKILVVSLLRLGDIIQQEPLLKALREQYPHAQIHLLINRQFTQVESLMDGLVDKYFYFDRESLQRGLGEANYNILWSHQRIHDLISELNVEGYTQAFNFTHNKLSAYLIGALRIPQKHGLYHADQKFQGLDNPWLRYFNDRFSGVQPSLFHYVELLGNAFGIPTQRSAVASTGKSKLVLFQCLTSDFKKNWSLSSFKKLKDTIETSLVDYKVKVLGASFEREALAQHFSDDELIICDLAGARLKLQEAALLVTGDTSIKHLAGQMGIPTVELVLGSSDWTKTAAFSQATQIVSANVPCSPCAHSGACSQKSHVCAEKISVDQVFAAVWDKLSKKAETTEATVRDIDRTAWKLYLDGQVQASAMGYANTAVQYANQFSKESLRRTLEAARKEQAQFDSWFTKLRESFPCREDLANKVQLKSQDIGEFILTTQDIIKSKTDAAGYFQSVVETLMTRFSSTLQFHEKMQGALVEVQQLLQSRGQFIHSLEIVLKEGAYYAAGIGQLSIDGFEEARAGVSRDREDAAL